MSSGCSFLTYILKELDWKAPVGPSIGNTLSLALWCSLALSLTTAASYLVSAPRKINDTGEQKQGVVTGWLGPSGC